MQQGRQPRGENMGRLVYFDLLDFARTKLEGDSEQIGYAIQCGMHGEAEVKMSILLGDTPAFPETFGWVSNTLLDFCSEGSDCRDDFLWLVEQGHIRICHRGRTLLEAAFNGFKDPNYDRLPGWPEHNTGNPITERMPLAEAIKSNAMVTGKYSNELSDNDRRRLEALKALSDRIDRSRYKKKEESRGDKLQRLLLRAAKQAERSNPVVSNLLLNCTDPAKTLDPNNRTALIRLLRTAAERGEGVPQETYDIIDGCYNKVTASCIDADPELTFPISRPSAREVLYQAIPNSYRGDLSEVHQMGIEDAADLTIIDWSEVRRFLTDSGSRGKIENKAKEYRAQKLAELIPRILIEKSEESPNQTTSFMLAIKRSRFALKWLAGPALVDAAASAMLPVSFPVHFIAPIVGRVLDSAFERAYNKAVFKPAMDFYFKRLEKKWLGLALNHHSTH